MQSLSHATKCQVTACAHGVLDTVPPAIWFIRRQMRRHRKGLSLAQFRTLCAVKRQPDISLSGLAEHLGASLPTASRTAAGLVARGFLIRNGSDNDRRQLALALSPIGRNVLESAWDATQKHMEEPIATLTSQERATVTDAMRILRGLFGSAGLPDPRNTKTPDNPRRNRRPSRPKSMLATGV